MLPFSLDEPDFSMGFFGTEVPHPVKQARGDDAWRELFRTLKQGGMNSFSGGPNVQFKGLMLPENRCLISPPSIVS